MNGSVTIVLCAAVVWTIGLGEATEAGLQRQKRRQTEISGGTRPAIPEIAGDYVLIYKPQPDVYTGKDTKHYKAGQRYTNWQPNDHTFIKGPDNRWHCFARLVWKSGNQEDPEQEQRTQDETANNLPEVTPNGAPQGSR